MEGGGSQSAVLPRASILDSAEGNTAERGQRARLVRSWDAVRPAAPQSTRHYSLMCSPCAQRQPCQASHRSAHAMRCFPQLRGECAPRCTDVHKTFAAVASGLHCTTHRSLRCATVSPAATRRRATSQTLEHKDATFPSKPQLRTVLLVLRGLSVALFCPGPVDVALIAAGHYEGVRQPGVKRGHETALVAPAGAAERTSAS